MEITAALRREIPVIPVLVQGMVTPRPDQLPGELEALVWRHAFEIRHARWENDVAELVKALRKIVSTSDPSNNITTLSGILLLIKRKWTVALTLGVACALPAMIYVLWSDIWPLACLPPPGGTQVPGGWLISLPRPVEGSEAEPNSHISQANQIELGKTYQGTLSGEDTDYFFLQTPIAGQVIRIIARVKGNLAVNVFNEKQEEIESLSNITGTFSDTFNLRNTSIHFLQFSIFWGEFLSYEFELRPESTS